MGTDGECHLEERIMGLFGDKDLKVVKKEITGLRLAIGMRHMAPPEAFDRGVESCVVDAGAALRRLHAKGRGADAVRVLDALTAASHLTGEKQELFLDVVGRIRGSVDGASA